MILVQGTVISRAGETKIRTRIQDEEQAVQCRNGSGRYKQSLKSDGTEERDSCQVPSQQKYETSKHDVRAVAEVEKEQEPDAGHAASFAEEGAKPAPQPVAPTDVRGKHLIESMDDALGQGSSRWVPNQRSQQTREVQETVGDHHQPEQDKMEEQQKTEQKEERGRMAEMCAFEWVFLVHRKMFLGGSRK